MSEKNFHSAGEVSGGVIAAATTAVSADLITSTIIVVIISSVFGGVLGFMTTRFMNWIFMKFDATKKNIQRRKGRQ